MNWSYSAVLGVMVRLQMSKYSCKKAARMETKEDKEQKR